MNIFDILKREHNVIKETFKQVEQATTPQRRLEIYRELQMHVLSHARGEHITLYARLEEEEEFEDILDQLEQEHVIVERLMQEITEMNENDPSWKQKIEELRENMDHHIQHEERNIFTRAEAALSAEEPEILGDAFLEEKEKIVAEI